MRRAAGGALVALFVVACGQGTTGQVASTSRTGSSPSASPTTMATRLTCGDSHIGATALALYQYPTPTAPFVDLLDVSDPLKPSLACTLSPASGARFLSATKLAYWNGDQLGTADLGSGAVRPTARLAASAGTGAFSADGTKFAYRVYDDAGGMTMHLFVNGSDRTLYVQEPLGGHGGPGLDFGPIDQLEFSPDGSLLLDYLIFRPQSGPPVFTVFRADGSTVFQGAGGPGGTWSPIGSTLFFYVYAPNQPGPVGDLNRLDASGRRQVVVNGLHGMNWPRMSPDGSGIIFNTNDVIPDSSAVSSTRSCGGVPHLWRLDLASGRETQISQSISAGPYFVQPNVVWSDEHQIGQCGPGGPTYADGMILAHDLRTGQDTTVDTTLMVPGIGGPPQPFFSTRNLLDTWFAPT